MAQCRMIEGALPLRYLLRHAAKHCDQCSRGGDGGGVVGGDDEGCAHHAGDLLRGIAGEGHGRMHRRRQCTTLLQGAQ